MRMVRAPACFRSLYLCLLRRKRAVKCNPLERVVLNLMEAASRW